MDIHLSIYKQLYRLGEKHKCARVIDEKTALSLYESHLDEIDPLGVDPYETELIQYLFTKYRPDSPLRRVVIRDDVLSHALQYFDRDYMAQAGVYFIGGAALHMMLPATRNVHDIDLLCNSDESFRDIRKMAHEGRFGCLLSDRDITLPFGVRPYIKSIFSLMLIDEIPIRLRLKASSDFPLSPGVVTSSGFPVLSKEDMFATKLIANTFRGSHPSARYKDLVDIGLMIEAWGDIPDEAWDKAEEATDIRSRRQLYNMANKLGSDIDAGIRFEEMGLSRGKAESVINVIRNI